MTARPISLAISTCPNDTFAFHAILNHEIDLQGLEFQIELLDIQELNSGLQSGRFDVAKTSFHAALLLAKETVVLTTGAALGFGVGPLLLAANQPTADQVRDWQFNAAKILSSDQDDAENLVAPDRGSSKQSSAPLIALCPGQLTTATLLFKLFYHQQLETGQIELRQVLFSDIMPQLRSGRADLGVCIHEGRFTWQTQGLSQIEDLGSRWENLTAAPLPLGGIVARRNLGFELIGKIQTIIRQSIQFALANRHRTLPTMKRYAAEFDDQVLFQHVDLYVNQWTIDIGSAENNGLNQLIHQAIKAGIISREDVKMEIFSQPF